MGWEKVRLRGRQDLGKAYRCRASQLVGTTGKKPHTITYTVPGEEPLKAETSLLGAKHGDPFSKENPFAIYASNVT